mmetsp:Transcript_7158/g.14366  ORF Transcript_7158/g.14366 Transcript_7158/m.14366 type:complete len:208 (+) Transcript_7158:1676-2299(+)
MVGTCHLCSYPHLHRSVSPQQRELPEGLRHRVAEVLRVDDGSSVRAEGSREELEGRLTLGANDQLPAGVQGPVEDVASSQVCDDERGVGLLCAAIFPKHNAGLGGPEIAHHRLADQRKHLTVGRPVLLRRLAEMRPVCSAELRGAASPSDAACMLAMDEAAVRIASVDQRDTVHVPVFLERKLSATHHCIAHEPLHHRHETLFEPVA